MDRPLDPAVSASGVNAGKGAFRPCTGDGRAKKVR